MNGLLLQFWQNTFHVKFYILNYILKLLKLVLKKEILWARDVAQWWSMRLSCARLWAPRPKKIQTLLENVIEFTVFQCSCIEQRMCKEGSLKSTNILSHGWVPSRHPGTALPATKPLEEFQTYYTSFFILLYFIFAFLRQCFILTWTDLELTM